MAAGKDATAETPADRETAAQGDEAAIAHAAASWFAHFLEPGATAADESEFRCWIEADERHARAYADIERIWLGAGMAPQLAQAQPLGRRRLLKNGAAGLLLIGGIGAAAWQATRPAGDYETAIGETRSIALSDGSTVELSTSSAISVNFTPQRRQITLLSGEAFFRVAREHRRGLFRLSRRFLRLGFSGRTCRRGRRQTVAAGGGGRLQHLLPRRCSLATRSNRYRNTACLAAGQAGLNLDALERGRRATGAMASRPHDRSGRCARQTAGDDDRRCQTPGKNRANPRRGPARHGHRLLPLAVGHPPALEHFKEKRRAVLRPEMRKHSRGIACTGA
jgi:hypothetical protein